VLGCIIQLALFRIKLVQKRLQAGVQPFAGRDQREQCAEWVFWRYMDFDDKTENLKRQVKKKRRFLFSGTQLETGDDGILPSRELGAEALTGVAVPDWHIW
jgi:hypothetical protein